VQPLQNQLCSFSESVRYNNELAANMKKLADISALGTDIGREVSVGSRVIDGTLSQRGFDGKVRTFSVDTSAQARHLRSTGLVGVAGRATLAYGVVDSAYTLKSGIEDRNSAEVFRGGIEATLLAVGVLSPPAGIAGGLTFFGLDSLSPLEGKESSSIDTLHSPCDPAYKPSKK
jgi:hypothetical protein